MACLRQVVDEACLMRGRFFSPLRKEGHKGLKKNFLKAASISVESKMSSLSGSSFGHALVAVK
jgi:hypothetical protein